MAKDINIGLGFRREIAQYFLEQDVISPDFIEVAPENWIDMGGYWGDIFRKVTDIYPLTLHGLSLSIGSPEDVDWPFLKKIKQFVKDFNVDVYSDHLTFAKMDNAHLYDLLPIPFREDAIKHVVQRIKEVQDFLERPLTIENASYYTPIAPEMSEQQFIKTIVEESDCRLLLDVNNVYVNAFNHHYNAEDFIDSMPLDKVSYIHMAGHYKIQPDMIIDTHGEAIIDPVYDLFDHTIQRMSPVPVLLERDFNFPDMKELKSEMDQLRTICAKHWTSDVIQ